MDDYIKALIEKLNIFDSMYDSVRIADPIKKKLMSYAGSELKETSDNCFEIWDRNSFCNNCISMRAVNENKSFIKIEKFNDDLLMVTAVPVELNGNKLVVELLKNVTDSMFFSGGNITQNVEIYEVINNLNILVLKDALTGIYNRRYIDERLPVEIIKLIETGRPLSIILADIDFFKVVNDTYGHFGGDGVLKEFAKVLRESIRDRSDWTARYGGEEFLICLPGADKETALKTAERIRKKIENMEFLYKDKIIKITSSFGVSTVSRDIIDENKSYKYEKLIEEADRNLYIAKETGRNKVVNDRG